MAGIASGFALAATVAIAQMSAAAQPERGHHGCPKGRRVVAVSGQRAAEQISTPAWLGVVYQERTSDVQQGAPVLQVYAGSPAASAGLRAGDVVTAVDGEVIDMRGELRALIRASRPGSTVTLTVERDGSQVAIPTTLGDLFAR
jgi:putative serine protease PepD